MGAAETRMMQSRRVANYGRTMREPVLLPSFLNSVRRKSKTPRESGRPELRSRRERSQPRTCFRSRIDHEHTQSGT